MNPSDSLLATIATAVKEYTKGTACTANVAFTLCRGINSATAQSAVVTWEDNTTSTIQLLAGDNPYAVKKVSVSGCVALY
jgi:hypothetical protein